MSEKKIVKNDDDKMVPVEAIPDFMKEDLNKGKDTIEDTILPRLRLLQGLSSDVSEGTGKVGEWAHTLNPEFHAKLFLFYPIFSFKQRVCFDKQTRKVVCKSENNNTPAGGCNPDGEVLTCSQCKYSQWVGMEKPACSQSINWVGSLDDNSVAAISFTNASFKIGKLLNTFLATSGNAPVFGRKFEIGSKFQGDGGQKYYVPTFRQIGLIDNAEKYNQQKAMYELLVRKKTVYIDNETDDVGNPTVVDDGEV